MWGDVVIYHQANLVTLHQGNCIEIMRAMPPNSVQCVITSPPYWGLRKYKGNQDQIWGGDKDCQHIFTLENRQTGQKHWNQGGQVIPNEDRVVHNGGIIQVGFCSLCGAWKGAFGLEPTPELYVQHTVEILREIRRVLRKDGTVFWNIGDSYVSGRGRWSSVAQTISGKQSEEQINCRPDQIGHPFLKDKDMALIPFRVAIAAQEDGWYVRSVIIWNKPNPMPESVKDRPTESHEYILLLTKSARYYWDMEAVREKYEGEVNHDLRDKSSEKYEGTNLFSEGGRDYYSNGGRNLRSVWTFPTHGYPEAHFATFPEALPERCIKAGTSEKGCCSKCGAPYERIVEDKTLNRTRQSGIGQDSAIGTMGRAGEVETQTLGWQPSCKCNAGIAPCSVLDPFCGSGTTIDMARRLGRHGIGIELSEEYCKLAKKRMNQEILV